MSRNSKLAPILFDYSLLLEEMETEWWLQGQADGGRQSDEQVVRAEEAGKAASADAFQIHEKIKQLDKLATKVQKLDFGMAEGEKLGSPASKS